MEDDGMRPSPEDRLQIEDTLLEYTWAVDLRDWDRLRAVFTADAVGDFSDPAFGQRPMSEIIDLFQEHSTGRGILSAQHFVTNQLVTLVGSDRARARAFFLVVWNLDPSDPGGDTTLLGGKYDLTVVRTAAGWKLQRMQALVDWDFGNKSMTAWVRTG